ncbi:IclR family transcriptional regulator [Mesorhizobium sp. M3A.F.Ca.ET.174.01.1.1]|uniref:IclR family transcriptional regulator n=1 Tax=unclassified Mesorhizobium TaxID=325217 RepID=UPI0010934382|nr:MULTISPECIES: IclR family transcriptional regulator [unclassified Mesorhizobium]TGS87418.1 IclR family transcriptional regulator [Mesorhizobium sp. M3A.F.Ca.ET.175.01.1.1]TGT27878.1 IclR family transcriptional regulator [Mesorhizobium sp. M3A.F.Ca.ET.174.01.1.1]
MKTLDTALKLLKLFEMEEQTLSVTEIAEATALPKSKVSRLLADFRANGFLEQDEQTRRYRVGLAAFELGSNYIKSQPLAHAALPVLRQIVDRTGHSTTLSVMRGDLILHILAVEGPHYIDGRWRVGNRLPFHATSAGKILLAGLTPGGFEAFIAGRKLDPITPSTVVDPKVFRQQVEEIRTTGVSLTRGESAPGLVAIAVPVLGRLNETVAALGLIIPDRFFVEAQTEDLTGLLHEEARTLSIKCGAQDYPYGSASSSLRPTLTSVALQN